MLREQKLFIVIYCLFMYFIGGKKCLCFLCHVRNFNSAEEDVCGLKLQKRESKRTCCHVLWPHEGSRGPDQRSDFFCCCCFFLLAVKTVIGRRPTETLCSVTRPLLWVSKVTFFFFRTVLFKTCLHDEKNKTKPQCSQYKRGHVEGFVLL